MYVGVSVLNVGCTHKPATKAPVIERLRTGVDRLTINKGLFHIMNHPIVNVQYFPGNVQKQ